MSRGRLAEEILEMVHRRLALAGIAFVRHTSPSVRVVGSLADQVPRLAFAAGGPPDYAGTLAGGRSVVFELKSTEAAKFSWTKAGRGRRELTRIRQLHDLEAHGRLGALAGLLIAFTGPMKRGGRAEFVWVDWTQASLLQTGTWDLSRLRTEARAELVEWRQGDPDWIEAAQAAIPKGARA